MPRLSIRPRLIGGLFGLVLLLSLAVAAAGLLGLRVQRSYDAAIEQGLEHERMAVEMQNAIEDARRAERAFLATWRALGFEPAYNRYIAENRRNMARARSLLAQLRPLAAAAGGKKDELASANLALLGQYLNVYEREFRVVVSFIGERGGTTVDTPDFEERLNAGLTKVQSAEAVITPVVRDIARSAKHRTTSHMAAAESVARTTFALVAGSFVLALSLGLGIVLVLGRRIKGSLESLGRAAEALGAGDLDARAASTSDDELGTPATSLNATSDRVRGLLASLEQRAVERKQAEDALRKNRELLQAIIDNSLAIIYVKDLRGRYLLVNRRFEQLFHMDKQAVMGKTDYDIFAPELAEVYRENDSRALAGNAPLELEERVALDDGYHHYISIKAPLNDAYGAHYAVCGISTDITQLKLIEEQLRQSQKMEAIGRLAGGIAHDFNNLLTVINGYSFLGLRSLDPSDPNHQLMLEIYNAGERAAGLTRQLLAYSRKQVLAPKICSLNSILTDLNGMLKRLIGEDVDLSVELAAEDVSILVERGQIEQIILNLVVNARDAMPQGGRLVLKSAKVVLDDAYVAAHPEALPGPHAVITVSDTGVGMTPDVVNRIFEPFFTTKGSSSGTGLGLAVVYGIVKQSGGSIDVESEPAKGTTFRIYLPEVREVKEAREPAVESRAHESDSTRGSETVLVVEDEHSVRDFLRQALEGKGYTVLTAQNGREALAIFERVDRAVAILVTDVVMPDMGGREVAQRLRRSLPGLPILYISGYAEHTAEHERMAGVGVDFLRKPFSPSELSKKIRNLLDGARAAQPAHP